MEAMEAILRVAFARDARRSIPILDRVCRGRHQTIHAIIGRHRSSSFKRCAKEADSIGKIQAAALVKRPAHCSYFIMTERKLGNAIIGEKVEREDYTTIFDRMSYSVQSKVT